MLRAFGLSDKGRVRPINEDCFAVHEDLGLVVVADGMGGHNAGEVAAQLAVDAVVDVVRDHVYQPHRGGAFPFGYDPSLSESGNLLRTAVRVACIHVVEAAGAADACAGMGTTLVAARVADGRLTVAHAGDSRLYVLSAGRLAQVTRDDSWMAAMLDENPAADLSALREHPMRDALTNVIGGAARTTVHVAERPLTGGEMLLLSTDGVHGVIDGPRLERMMRDADDPRILALRLVSAALAFGSRDNCTAVVAQYRPA